MKREIQAQWGKLKLILESKPLVYIEQNICYVGIGDERDKIEISTDLLKHLLTLSVVITQKRCPDYDANRIPRFILFQIGQKYICLNAHTLLRYTLTNSKGILILLTHHFPELYTTQIICKDTVSLTKIANHLAPFGFCKEKKNHVLNPYYHEILKGRNNISFTLDDKDVRLCTHTSGDKGNAKIILCTYKILGELQTQCPKHILKSIGQKVDPFLTFWSVMNDIVTLVLEKNKKTELHKKFKELIPSMQERDNKRIMKLLKDNSHIIGDVFTKKYLPLLYAYKEEHEVWPLQTYLKTQKIDICPCILEAEHQLFEKSKKKKKKTKNQ